MIGIIYTGIGNPASVSRMISKAGGSSLVIESPSQLSEVNKLILPGVGRFDAGMKALASAGFADAISRNVLNGGRPLLGICLGMQLLCRKSDEGGLDGLGLIDADVRKFAFNPNSSLKIPHMGWNTTTTVRDNPLLPPTAEERRFYFVHSFKVVASDPTISISTADYGGEFCAAFQKGNIFGVQFHPEKSHRFGMELMKRFIEL